MVVCERCHDKRATIKRPKTHQRVCTSCFSLLFEQETHDTITKYSLFAPGEIVAIGASGGKGIKGYRDDSLATVQSNSRFYNLPLTVLSYKDLYGYTMDEIVKMTGPKSNCTFCGVFRRQALDRGAEMVKVDHLVTGHNADDIAETVLMNVMRGDVVRLRRCTEIVTKSNRCIKRSKPLKYAYEKEVVMYAYFNRLEYFSTECTYSPAAYRGFARTFIKDLEAIRPRAIIG